MPSPLTERLEMYHSLASSGHTALSDTFLLSALKIHLGDHLHYSPSTGQLQNPLLSGRTAYLSRLAQPRFEQLTSDLVTELLRRDGASASLRGSLCVLPPRPDALAAFAQLPEEDFLALLSDFAYELSRRRSSWLERPDDGDVAVAPPGGSGTALARLTAFLAPWSPESESEPGAGESYDVERLLPPQRAKTGGFWRRAWREKRGWESSRMRERGFQEPRTSHACVPSPSGLGTVHEDACGSWAEDDEISPRTMAFPPDMEALVDMLQQTPIEPLSPPSSPGKVLRIWKSIPSPDDNNFHAIDRFPNSYHNKRWARDFTLQPYQLDWTVTVTPADQKSLATTTPTTPVPVTPSSRLSNSNSSLSNRRRRAASSILTPATASPRSSFFSARTSLTASFYSTYTSQLQPSTPTTATTTTTTTTPTRTPTRRRFSIAAAVFTPPANPDFTCRGFGAAAAAAVAVGGLFTVL